CCEIVNSRSHHIRRRRYAPKGDVNENADLVFPRRGLTVLISYPGENGVHHVTPLGFTRTLFEVFAQIIEHPSKVGCALLDRSERAPLDSINQHRQLIDRYTQDVLEECPTWQDGTKLTDELTSAVVDETIDQRVDVLPDRRFVPRHRTGRQVRVQSTTPGC